MGEEEDVEIIDNKPYYKKKQCVFCNRNMLIKLIGNDFMELSCEDHPNYTLYLADDPFDFFKGETKDNK